ncbi:MAG: endolytic transglycosylase MltG, partial [Lachnospiraceae bacterium]|nr:endolytic transglycosylase MltG [Lachnospiraceae bacterium]
KISTLISGILNFIVRAVIVVIVIYAVKQVCITAYDYGYRIYSEPPMAEGEGIDIVVTIPMGSSVMETGELLKGYGLIRDEKLFYLQERFSDYHDKMEPGVYTLNTAMTAEEMMAQMSPSISEESTEEAEAAENVGPSEASGMIKTEEPDGMAEEDETDGEAEEAEEDEE